MSALENLPSEESLLRFLLFVNVIEVGVDVKKLSVCRSASVTGKDLCARCLAKSLLA